MGHARNRRQRKRRARAIGEHVGASPEREAVEQSHDAAISSNVLTEADKARALARFGSMRGRGGVRISFTTFVPIVPVSDPAELRARVLGGRDSRPS